MGKKPKTAAEIVGELEIQLAGSPDSFDKYGQLIDNCVKSNAKPRALHCVDLGKKFLSSHDMSTLRRFEFATALISVWKMEKFSKKSTDGFKINDTIERKQYLLDAHEIFVNLPPSEDTNLNHEIMLAFAFVKECLGLLSESLAILSDLITAEADESVELAYIIFKAAVILKRLGQTGQALEYLEFLQDDPPRRSAISRTHILALLTLTFDQGGDKYAVVLQQTYPLLKEAYIEDIQNGPNPEATLIKVQKQFKQKPIEMSSEIWEVLSLQMLERSETVFCAELFHQATLKAPNKASVLFTCAEMTWILNDRERALKYAERAYQIQPQNGDLRNFLLLLDPDSWTDKLRTALPVGTSQINADEEARRLDAMGSGAKSRVKKKETHGEPHPEEDSWLHSHTLKPVAKKDKEAVEAKSAADAKKTPAKKSTGAKKKSDKDETDSKPEKKKKKKKSVGNVASVVENIGATSVIGPISASDEKLVANKQPGGITVDIKEDIHKPSRPRKPEFASDPDIQKSFRTGEVLPS